MPKRNNGNVATHSAFSAKLAAKGALRLRQVSRRGTVRREYDGIRHKTQYFQDDDFKVTVVFKVTMVPGHILLLMFQVSSDQRTVQSFVTNFILEQNSCSCRSHVEAELLCEELCG